MIHIGIDTGTHTGFAVWDSNKRQFLEIKTVTISKAMDMVRIYQHEVPKGEEIRIYIEDARKRRWFGNAGREKLQGAGSVKRDAGIWETFCVENGIHFQMVAPKNNRTKLTAAQFRKITGWTKTTSEHGRDAAFLVFGK